MLKHQAACETTDGSRGPTSGNPQLKRCSSSSSFFSHSSFRAHLNGLLSAEFDFSKNDCCINSPVFVINSVVEFKLFSIATIELDKSDKYKCKINYFSGAEVHI